MHLLGLFRTLTIPSLQVSRILKLGSKPPNLRKRFCRGLTVYMLIFSQVFTMQGKTAFRALLQMANHNEI